MNRRKSRSVMVTMVALSFFFTTLIATPQAQASETSDEQQFVQLINNLRTSKGLDPLQVDSQLDAASKNWAGEMSKSDRLKHSPNIAAGLSHNWSVLGENVGVHSNQGSVKALFDAFVASPTHYENLVNPQFQYIGVGVVYNNSTGKMWTTHRFMAVHSAITTTSTTTAAPTTPSTTAPVQTTSPTTVSSTTVSTTAPTSTATSSTRSSSTRSSSTQSTGGTTPSSTTASSIRSSSSTTQGSTTTLSSRSNATAIESTSPNSDVQVDSFTGSNRFTKNELLQLLVDGFARS